MRGINLICIKKYLFKSNRFMQLWVRYSNAMWDVGALAKVEQRMVQRGIQGLMPTDLRDVNCADERLKPLLRRKLVK